MRDLIDAAMGWLVKTESPDCTSVERDAYEQWLAEDVRHRVAHTIAVKARDRMDRLSSIRPLDGTVDADLLLSPEYAPRSIQRARVADTQPPPASGAPSRRKWFGLVAVSVVSIGALCAASLYASEQLTWEDYATHVGGRQTAPLPDGSAVTLNTDTDLRVRLTPAARELELVRGEALIKVAHDDNRPFTLIAGRTAIQTAAGEFDIRKLDSGELDLIVNDGSVDAESVESPLESVLHLASSPPSQSVIAAGYRASIRPRDVQVSLLGADESARKTAWLHDVLDFRGETLAQAVEEFNRYNLRKIVIDDPSIAERHVGGVFQNNDPESFVEALAKVMDIRARTVGGEEGPGYGTIRLTSAQAFR